jgi:hypothetical protein
MNLVRNLVLCSSHIALSDPLHTMVVKQLLVIFCTVRCKKYLRKGVGSANVDSCMSYLILSSKNEGIKSSRLVVM